jgi:hypothetical protein
MMRLVLTLLLLLIASPTIAGDAPIEWAARKWIESAECARTTGKIMVICSNGGIEALANHDPGDDPGHALVLDSYSAITGNSVSPSDILILNNVVNVGGMLLLAVLLFVLRLPLASLAVIGFGIYIVRSYQDIAPHPAQLGLACLAALFPVALLGLPLSCACRRTLVLWLLTGLASLVVVSFFRQSLALMGLLASLAAICARFAFFNRSKRDAIGMILGLLLAYQSPAALFAIRDYAYDLPPALGSERHGPWHSLYIGLGVIDNPFGIEWVDENGFDRARKVAPGVRIVSNEYFAVMRHEYLSIVSANPVTVSVIYYKKLKSALAGPLLGFPDNLKIFYLLSVIGLGAVVVMAFRPSLTPAIMTFSVSLVFIGLFLLQSAMIHYKMLYLFPIQIFIALALASLAEMLRRHLVSQNPNDGCKASRPDQRDLIKSNSAG